MNKLRYSLIALLGVLILIAPSCQLQETNDDPTRLSDVNLNLILPAALSQTAYNQSSNPARISGILMQHFEGFDAQQVQYTDYVLEGNTFNNYWQFGLYSGVLKDCRVMIDKANEEDQPYYRGIAKILMAQGFAEAASFFGDVPYTDALKGTESLQPVYDTQEQVFAGVQQLLDEAIIDLSGAAVPGGPSGDDLIFGGDGAKWVATARALKARYFMHLTKRDDQAASKALAEIGQAFGSTADQPNFAWESNINSNNPLAKFGLERPNTLIIDSRFGQALIDREDPRKDFYVAEPEPGTFQYFQSGNSNLVWVQNNSVIPIISYAELKFLEAEALLRTGADDATISAALEAAITATMDQIGIDPAVYADYVAANSDVSGLGGFEEKLEKIITEAYYGYYGYAFQQIWTNFRRTGYPDLTPSPNGSNGVNPSGVVPRRFLYPNSEDNTNSENLNAARSRQNGALLDADTWAFE